MPFGDDETPERRCVWVPVKDLRELIAYNWDTELEDYVSNCGGETGNSRGSHVLHHLVALQNAIDGTSITADDYAKQYNAREAES